jgi:hypothetical protein
MLNARMALASSRREGIITPRIKKPRIFADKPPSGQPRNSFPKAAVFRKINKLQNIT